MRGPLAVVAMSGGVDSSVAAALLREAGYRVLGVSLRLWDSPRSEDPSVCSNFEDAARVAGYLGIPHTVLDLRSEFSSKVVDRFAREVVAGRTPNPCHACNSQFKLGWLLEWALEQGAELVATGHYARIDRRDGIPRLLRGVDSSRDQSYFLFELSRRQLERARFPLGDWTKAEVRAEARRLGLPVAEKAESRDLCFGSVPALVASRGLVSPAGEVVLENGESLGSHEGIARFTVGQRRGLGVAYGRPLYVQRVEADTGRVVVGERPPRARGLRARGWRWVVEEPMPRDGLGFQVRYRQRPISGSIEAQGDRAWIRFEEPAGAVAPGQAVVAYRGEEVLGGGWIEEALDGA